MVGQLISWVGEEEIGEVKRGGGERMEGGNNGKCFLDGKTIESGC